MLLSLSWLREFTPYEGTAEALGDRLTMLGLELEDIRRPYDSISSIVVGLVAACEDHPESDHLHICKVDAGQGELLDIVCGAPNVAEGQKVPFGIAIHADKTIHRFHHVSLGYTLGLGTDADIKAVK